MKARTREIGSKRVKLILKFLERVHQNSHQIASVEMVSDEAIKLSWWQDNQRDNIMCRFSNLYSFNQEKRQIGKKLNDFPMATQYLTSSCSPSNTFKVLVQQADSSDTSKSNQVLEVFRDEDLVSSINLQNHHQQIFEDDSMTSIISWNKLETKFLYMAQVKTKPTKRFFDVEEDEDIEDVQRNYQLQQDYGECMCEITQTHLFEYNVENHTLCNIKLPENIFPCYPQYLDAEGESVILQGHKEHLEFKYGIQVLNRYADIYLLTNLQRKQLFPAPKSDSISSDNKPVEFRVISQDEVSLKPNLSYDGKKIAYFGSPLNPPHLNYLALKIINTSDWTIEEILPVKKGKFFDSGEFLGVCNYSCSLKDSFWMNDNKHYTFSSLYGPSLSSYIVNTETKKIARFNPHKYLSDEFQVIHYNPLYNALFAAHVNIVEPRQLAYLKNLDLTQDVQSIVDNAQWQYISLTQGKSSIFPSLRDSALQHLEEQTIKSGEASGILLRIKQFNKNIFPNELLELYNNNQFLNPLNYKEDERPLLVDLHGGPHATHGGEFTIVSLYSLLMGYTVLAPNFSGSGGYGQEFIEKLLTNIGEVDAQEVINMVDQVIDMKLCNPKKVIIIGGSYGGYLGAIMTSKYSDRFICSALCNPVLNIPCMLNTTDIPDWCIAESLGKNMTWNLTGDDYKKMFEKSPMSLINKVPTLNLVGESDKRVPYQQSIAYHAQNVQNGNEIETFVFKESDHSLTDFVSPCFEAIVKQITFIEKHLIKQSMQES